MIEEKLDWREKKNNGIFYIRKVFFVFIVCWVLLGFCLYKLKYVLDLFLYMLFVSLVFFLL